MQKTKVTVKKFNTFGSGLLAGSPRLINAPFEYPSGLNSILFEFYISVEISDGETVLELLLHPLIDAEKIKLVDLVSFGDESMFSISKFDDVFPTISSEVLAKFYIQVSDSEWMMKRELMQEIVNEIDKGLPAYVNQAGGILTASFDIHERNG